MPPREIGSWMQVTPCVATNQGIYPISNKTGGLDTEFSPKNFDFGPYQNTGQVEKVVNAMGFNVPLGVPGLLVQGISATNYEYYFFPSGNFIAVDHKSEQGLSTRVFPVTENGYIDVSGDQAPSLDSIFRVFLNAKGAKTLAINGTKAGKDITGYFPVVQQIDAETLTTSSPLKLIYLAAEKGGPVSAGPRKDTRATKGKEGYESPARLSSKALFFRNTDNADGPRLDYLEPMPELGDNILEAKLVFDLNLKKWRRYVEIGQTKKLARIRFNYDLLDTSEGEIMELESSVYMPTGKLIWIDYEKSMKPYAFGDSAIYSIEQVEKKYSRFGVERPLYRILSTYESGEKATHIRTLSKINKSALVYTNAILKPWLNPQGAEIKTTIAGKKKENIIRYDIPAQWDITKGNYKWLEITGIDCAYNTAPISPTPRSNTDDFLRTGEMESQDAKGSTYTLRRGT